MKLALIFLIVLPLAMSAPRSSILDSLNPVVLALKSIFHTDELKQMTIAIIHEMGSDEREAECELLSKKFVQTHVSAGTYERLLEHTTPVFCHGIKEIAGYFDVPIPPQTGAQMPQTGTVH